jgi:predicted GIY-YIG superfamily endonuclease
MTEEEVIGGWKKREKSGLGSGKQGQWRDLEDEFRRQKQRMSRHSKNRGSLYLKGRPKTTVQS